MDETMAKFLRDPTVTERLEAILLVASELGSRPASPDFQVADLMSDFCQLADAEIVAVVLGDLGSSSWRDRRKQIAPPPADVYKLQLQRAPRAELQRVCPDIVASSRLVHVAVLADSIYRYFAQDAADRQVLARPPAELDLKPKNLLKHALELMVQTSVDALRAGPVYSVDSPPTTPTNDMRRWFGRHTAALVDPSLPSPVFVKTASGFEIPDGTPFKSAEYSAIGRFIALSLIENVPLGIEFGRTFASFLVGSQTDLTLEDLSVLVPGNRAEIVRLTEIANGVVPDGLSFVGDKGKGIGGRKPDDLVTLETRMKYVSAYISEVLARRITRHYRALAAGFAEVVAPVSTMTPIGVTFAHLKKLILGDPFELDSAITYPDVSLMDQPTPIDWFKEWISASPANGQRFLEATTGFTSRVPFGGLSAWKINIEVYFVSGDSTEVRPGQFGVPLLPDRDSVHMALNQPWL